MVDSDAVQADLYEITAEESPSGNLGQNIIDRIIGVIDEKDRVDADSSLAALPALSLALRYGCMGDQQSKSCRGKATISSNRRNIISDLLGANRRRSEE